MKPYAIVKLGNAWAKNSVNTAIFRGNGIVSNAHYQFAAFFTDEYNIRIAKICLEKLSLSEVEDIVVPVSARDAHNAINIALDSSEKLHICLCDHAGTPFYAKAKMPNS